MLDRPIWNGWALFGVLSLVLALMSGAMLAVAGLDTDGWRLVIRSTARSSLVLFLAAFIASTVLARWPGPLGQWLVRNRRAFGLGFAMSHLIHLAAIIVFARTDWATFWSMSSTGAIVAGSIAYVVIGVLAATSFDAMVRWLGISRWKRIHRFGLWFVWLFFVFTNGKRIPDSGWYLLPVAALIAAAYLRVKGGRRRIATLSGPQGQPGSAAP